MKEQEHKTLDNKNTSSAILQQLKEEIENTPAIIAQTLETYYKPSITQETRDENGSYKVAVFPITFAGNKIINFSITFIDSNNTGLAIKLAPENQNNETYTIDGTNVIKNQPAQNRDSGDTILGYSYDAFNKALIKSKPVIAQTEPTTKSAKKPAPRPQLPEAITSSYEFLDEKDFTKLLQSTDTKVSQEECNKLINKYGYVGFLSFIQAKDGLITIDQADRILQGYSHFKSAVLTQYSEFSKQSNIFEIAGQGPLANIKDPHTRVLAFSLLQYYRLYVEYDNSGNQGKTFIGFAGYRHHFKRIYFKPVKMDCDIMSMVAADIFRSQGIDIDLLINYDQISGVANHANTEIDNTVIERTNAEHWGQPNSTIMGTAYPGSSAIGKFFETYAQSPKQEGEHDLLDIQKGFIAFALGTSLISCKELEYSLHNFGTQEYNSGDYSTVNIADYEYAASILGEYKTQSKIKYGDDPQYKALASNITILINELNRKIDKLKKKKPQENYTQLDAIMKSLSE